MISDQASFPPTYTFLACLQPLRSIHCSTMPNSSTKPARPPSLLVSFLSSSGWLSDDDFFAEQQTRKISVFEDDGTLKADGEVMDPTVAIASQVPMTLFFKITRGRIREEIADPEWVRQSPQKLDPADVTDSNGLIGDNRRERRRERRRKEWRIGWGGK